MTYTNKVEKYLRAFARMQADVQTSGKNLFVTGSLKHDDESPFWDAVNIWNREHPIRFRAQAKVVTDVVKICMASYRFVSRMGN